MTTTDGFANVIGGRFLERQAKQYRTDTSQPVRRPTFVKTHGCATGTFTVDADLPKEFRVGVFAGSQYEALVRFSSDPAQDPSDLAGNTVGMAIKLLGVPGPKLLDGSTDSESQDFLLQNSDVFPVGNAQQFMELMEVALAGGAEAYMGLHPEVGEIMGAMKKSEESVLWAQYNSTTPYRFGLKGGRYVKYSAAIRKRTGGPAIPLKKRDKDYLGTDFVRRLAKAGSTLDFFCQFYVDAETTPLDDTTVAWDEEASTPCRVASLRLPKQAVADPCAFDHLAFNPWHTLAEHEPVGSMNNARRIAYVLSADARRRMNGVDVAEPKH